MYLLLHLCIYCFTFLFPLSIYLVIYLCYLYTVSIYLNNALYVCVKLKTFF